MANNMYDPFSNINSSNYMYGGNTNLGSLSPSLTNMNFSGGLTPLNSSMTSMYSPQSMFGAVSGSLTNAPLNYSSSIAPLQSSYNVSDSPATSTRSSVAPQTSNPYSITPYSTTAYRGSGSFPATIPTTNFNFNAANPFDPTAQSNPTFNLTQLMNTIKATSPTVTTNTSNLTKQNYSPQLEAAMNNYISQLNQLGTNTQSAFQGEENSFANVIAGLTNTYGALGSGQAGAAQTSALATGLSPLEAMQAGANQQQQVMQQYYPQYASLQQQRAQVPIALQQQLAQNQQNLALPFLQNVQTPYYSNLAGQTTKGTQTVTDPLAKLQLMANANNMWQNNALGWAQLQQAGQEYNQSQQQQYAEYQQGLQNAMQQLIQGQQSTPYQQAGIEATQQSQQQQIAANQYMQQLAGQQRMGQIGLEGANQLKNIYGGATSRTQEAKDIMQYAQQLTTTPAQTGAGSKARDVFNGISATDNTTVTGNDNWIPYTGSNATTFTPFM
jgi:hypothetical protein